MFPVSLAPRRGEQSWACSLRTCSAMAPIGVPYKRFDPGGRFDAIVIGSGIGGMGAAALLAKAEGWRLLVLERHYTAGGFTHTFHRPGFEWDVGVHYIGQVHKPESPAYARFAQRDLGPRTPIRNLFLTGQDVGTAGVMGALSGAVTSASAILGRNMFGVISKSAAAA